MFSIFTSFFLVLFWEGVGAGETFPNFGPENQSRSRCFQLTMSLRTSKTTTTYRAVKAVSPVSPEPVAASAVVSARSASPLPYAVNGYETLRYLVPVQQQQPQQQQFVLVQQPMVQQQMVQQVMTPVYMQNLQGLQHLSVSNQDAELLYLQQGAAAVSKRASSARNKHLHLFREWH